ncbi:MAG TPA: omptin family outer membrane protease [Devosia sp.]|uniref:omptin family outer membrane protease n=1 Tax=Devosia sp. TaxID=1871048 RepID=UPI002F9393BC
MKFQLVALLTAALLSPAALQAQETTFQNADKSVTLSGGLGVLAIESREYVFSSSGGSDYLSLLIWQSAAPLLSASLDVELPEDWSIIADAAVAVSGDSYMEDYDWFPAYLVGPPNMNNWTHQSKHPNTNLDWYFNGSLHAAYKVKLESGTTIQLRGGLEYTDVQWTASGGSAIYSVGGFRNVSGNFPPGRAITYRQQFPALVTGVNAIFDRGDWVFDFGAKVGVTFSAKATDDHWLRDLRFAEDVYMAPLVGLSGSATRKISDNLDVVLSAKMDRIFLGRSNTNYFSIPTGAPLGSSVNASGADLLSGALKVSLKGSF